METNTPTVHATHNPSGCSWVDAATSLLMTEQGVRPTPSPNSQTSQNCSGLIWGGEFANLNISIKPRTLLTKTQNHNRAVHKKFIVSSWHYNVETPLPEKGLPKTGNHCPDELLICHFRRQLDSSFWIFQTPQSPMCRQDKTLQTL